MTVGIWDDNGSSGIRYILNQGNDSVAETADTGKTSFMSYLNEALQEVNTLQWDADLSAQKLALGEEEYLHNTMIAYEKATLALQLTIEIRNKLVEAYQEIMRIQM